MAGKKRGVKPTSALFYELSAGEHNSLSIADVEPIYSLAEFHKVFLEEADLTEYKAAMRLVGDWVEWNRLKRGSSVFRQLVDAWKEEVKQKMLSDAQTRIVELMQNESPTVSLSAAKWLAEQRMEGNGKGRPSKEAIEAQEKKLANAARITEEEFSRVKDFVNSKEMQ